MNPSPPPPQRILRGVLVALLVEAVGFAIVAAALRIGH